MSEIFLDTETTGLSYREGHKIVEILEEDESYNIYIEKNKEVLPWKTFNKNMAIAIEYNLQY